MTFPPGHFFSPVVDPETVKDYVARYDNIDPSEIAGIEFPLDEMYRFWNQNLSSFRYEPSSGERYFASPLAYPGSDGRTLRAMIGAFRPKRIIEVGSGGSTACALDAIDQFGVATEFTCIEPYPKALESALGGDMRRVNLIEKIVQDVPVSVFQALEENDILFIDSTHVLKTGSDVHYELFEILPAIKPGVLIHFHDCRYPFEYPKPFIFERNYSWNEAYALRAFLMFNPFFKIVFYNSLFARVFRSVVHDTCPQFFPNPGSSIWLRRIAAK
ncbi:class I SAM-dependent methyltransferase [Bradyrhizobium sp. HKCCYLS2038]|uniref:class I SAM-dependent methyltransferase n=1 Tax=unclassified Bradyrhizobium TaxID=2631580 RepID=UPI003EBCE042